MKHRSTQPPVIPIGWQAKPKDPAKAFNRWQRMIQREVDKIRNTNVADKYFV